MRQQHVREHELRPGRRLQAVQLPEREQRPLAMAIAERRLGRLESRTRSTAGMIVVSRSTDSNSLVVSKLRFSSAIGIDAVGFEPRSDVVVAVALLLEEPADLVLRQHLVGRRPVVARAADLLGQVVEIAHVQDRRQREVRGPVRGSTVGRHLEAA